jgi:hypothetical protein
MRMLFDGSSTVPLYCNMCLKFEKEVPVLLLKCLQDGLRRRPISLQSVGHSVMVNVSLVVKTVQELLEVLQSL